MPGGGPRGPPPGMPWGGPGGPRPPGGPIGPPCIGGPGGPPPGPGGPRPCKQRNEPFRTGEVQFGSLVLSSSPTIFGTVFRICVWQLIREGFIHICLWSASPEVGVPRPGAGRAGRPSSCFRRGAGLLRLGRDPADRRPSPFPAPAARSSPSA